MDDRLKEIMAEYEAKQEEIKSRIEKLEQDEKKIGELKSNMSSLNGRIGNFTKKERNIDAEIATLEAELENPSYPEYTDDVKTKIADLESHLKYLETISSDWNIKAELKSKGLQENSEEYRLAERMLMADGELKKNDTLNKINNIKSEVKAKYLDELTKKIADLKMEKDNISLQKDQISEDLSSVKEEYSDRKQKESDKKDNEAYRISLGLDPLNDSLTNVLYKESAEIKDNSRIKLFAYEREITKKIADLDDRMRKIYSDETLNAGIRLSMAGPIRKERTSLIAIKDEIAKCKGDLSLTKEEIKILLRGLAPHEQTIYDERNLGRINNEEVIEPVSAVKEPENEEITPVDEPVVAPGKKLATVQDIITSLRNNTVPVVPIEEPTEEIGDQPSSLEPSSIDKFVWGEEELDTPKEIENTDEFVEPFEEADEELGAAPTIDLEDDLVVPTAGQSKTDDLARVMGDSVFKYFEPTEPSTDLNDEEETIEDSIDWADVKDNSKLSEPRYTDNGDNRDFETGMDLIKGIYEELLAAVPNLHTYNFDDSKSNDSRVYINAGSTNVGVSDDLKGESVGLPCNQLVSYSEIATAISNLKLRNAGRKFTVKSEKISFSFKSSDLKKLRKALAKCTQYSLSKGITSDNLQYNSEGDSIEIAQSSNPGGKYINRDELMSYIQTSYKKKRLGFITSALDKLVKSNKVEDEFDDELDEETVKEKTKGY